LKTTLPVAKNQQLTVAITDLNHDGQGVGKIDGYTLFVPNALPGEKVRVQVVKVNKHYGYAKLLAHEQTSGERVVPPCPIYDRCGGCQIQHLSYEGQLKFKQNLVEENLRRIGHLDLQNVKVHPIIGMAEPWRYRNKSQLPIGTDEEGGLIGGFYAKRSHRIIEMDACLIQHPENDRLVNRVKRIAQELGVPAYDEATGRGVLRHVLARIGFNSGEKMLVLVTNGADFAGKAQLIGRLAEEVESLTSLVQNVNTKKTNVILGERNITLYGRDAIYDAIGGIRFIISPHSFYQVNPVQTEILYRKALEYADLNGTETVIDAYCGVGTIALFLARQAKQVYGVEIVPEAISDAKKNARLNGSDNVNFVVGKAEEVMPLWAAQGIRADVIIVDPPRKGCDETLLETIARMQPKRVVYVSCNPSTLARDLRYLSDRGYRAEEVQPVDMFPHTVHVECVIGMQRIDT
jgi:23S rRNA (uracil1939-C5)-methyltransferase